MNSDYIECFRKAAAVLLIVATVAAVLCLTGCRAQKPLTNTIETVRIEREVIRDTTIVTKADSASIQALFVCDSTNQVVLRQLETLQGERIKPTVIIQHTDAGAAVVFDCHEDSLQHEIALRDRIIEEQSKQTEQVAVRIRSGYDKFCSWGFWLLVIVILLRLAWWAAKMYIKSQGGGLFLPKS